MRQCEACGQPFAEPATHCTRCGHPLAVAAGAGHLSRVSIAGNPGPVSYEFEGRARPTAPVTPVTPASAVSPEEPSSPGSPDYDPDATTRFAPIYASHSKAKNNAALAAARAAGAAPYDAVIRTCIQRGDFFSFLTAGREHDNWDLTPASQLFNHRDTVYIG